MNDHWTDIADVAWERDRLRRERDEARALVGRLVQAMESWGAEGDGVPEPAAGSDIGAAYDAARAHLALCEIGGKP